MRVVVLQKEGPSRDRLRGALEDAGHRIAWMSDDTVDAIERSSRSPPDAVLFSVEIVGGAARAAEVARDLASVAPVVVTYSRDRELAWVDAALAAGAANAVEWSGSPESCSVLHARLSAVARLSGAMHRRAPEPCSIVLLGASTGGPEALATIVSGLPPDFGGALVVVQHIEAAYVTTLTESLSSRTTLRVDAAEDGERLSGGRIVIAAREDQHLVLTPDRMLRYVAEPSHTTHRPSVDVLFESAMPVPCHGTAVLLTGMGRDGARGLLALRQAGWHTIAQDESTSAVYGMPRAAVATGGACEILPVDAIAAGIVRSAQRERPRSARG